MTECTQPELWANRPRSDASEEEVARYLDHLDQCAFHAAIENGEEDVVRGIAAVAAASEEGPVNLSSVRGAAIHVTPVHPQRRWAFVLKLAAAIALVAAIFLFYFYFLRTRSTPQQAVTPGPSPVASPSPENERFTAKDPTPAPSVAPNINSRRPVPTSIATVKRIYVGHAEGEYNQLLREALIAQLRQNGRFTVVSRVEDADAVLETEGTRGPNVRAQLVNRTGKPLWFTVQSTTEESASGATELATKIIRALNQAN